MQLITIWLASLYLASAVTEQKVGQPFRNWLTDRTLNHPKTWAHWVRELLLCRICLSIWVAVPLAHIWIYQPARHALTGIAAAGAGLVWIELTKALKTPVASTPPAMSMTEAGKKIAYAEVPEISKATKAKAVPKDDA